MKLPRYITPGEEGQVLEQVDPTPITRGKSVWITDQDADVMEEVGLALCRLGALEGGQRLLNVVAAWRIS